MPHKKITILDMKRIAGEHGGKCLSENYINSGIKLLWQCRKGHQWEAVPNSIKAGSWCPYCAGNIKKTIDDMHSLAGEHGGKCLSETYINSGIKLLWECKEGHRWKARPCNIKAGSWCPYCSGTAKKTIEDMHSLAGEQNGKCLSSTYINDMTKLLWQCRKGHQWEAVPNSIKAGSWCPYCAGNIKKAIDDMHKLAGEHGGKCLSDTYVNSFTKLLWQCRKGHQWEATPSNIMSGKWCPECAILRRGDALRHTIEDIRKLAKERGGKCLSDTYEDTHTHLIWQCAHGHKWKATPSKIKQGKWCPECSRGLGERICREFFEQLFENKFPKSRPKWLVNSRGNKMELDGYCRPLGLAFEHHGEQHYSSNIHYISTEKELRQRQMDDKLKRELCACNGISLIEIPQIGLRITINEVKSFIKRECRSKGFSIPDNFSKKKVDLKKAYISSTASKQRLLLQKIAEKRGGKCLSEHYVNANTHLIWQCKRSHQWKATPSNIKRGKWCPRCFGRGKTIEDMHKLAKERGGKCLSTKYTGVAKKLLWECEHGHQWEATPSKVQQGRWCHYCAGRCKTIEDMHKLAKERGGKCISSEYVNATTKLLWQCRKGHQWEAVSNSIKAGSWCPYCAGNIKKTIDDMHKLAREKGGKCLSIKYIRSRIKLLWECEHGHQWEATPSKVQQGRWCPYCTGRAVSEDIDRNVCSFQKT